MPLPTSPTGKSRTMPRSMIVMGKPKRGKSTIMAGLTTQFAPGKSLILSVGEYGYEDQDATYVQCKTARAFNDTLDEIEQANAAEGDYRYDFIITDHLSKLDEWAEILGTLNYMKSSQGRNFNFRDAGNPNAKGPGWSPNTAAQYFMPGDPEFRSVYTLPNGGGYRFGRQVAFDWLYRLEGLAKFNIIVGHIKMDRFTKEDAGKTVNSAFLNATGQIGTKYTQHVDAIGVFSRKGDKGMLSFKRANADYDAGSRYSYLDNQIFEISTKDPNSDHVLTNWDLIFPQYELQIV